MGFNSNYGDYTSKQIPYIQVGSQNYGDKKTGEVSQGYIPIAGEGVAETTQGDVLEINGKAVTDVPVDEMTEQKGKLNQWLHGLFKSNKIDKTTLAMIDSLPIDDKAKKAIVKDLKRHPESFENAQTIVNQYNNLVLGIMDSAVETHLVNPVKFENRMSNEIALDEEFPKLFQKDEAIA